MPSDAAIAEEILLNIGLTTRLPGIGTRKNSIMKKRAP